MSNDSDPGKHQDASAVPGSDADTNAAEDVFCLLLTAYRSIHALDGLLFADMLQRPFMLLYHVPAAARAQPQPGLGIKRQLIRESLGDLEHVVEPGMPWIHTVSKEIVDSVSDQDKRRQEAINEVIYTECDFVRDMEYLRDVCVAFLVLLTSVLMRCILGLDSASQCVGYHTRTPSSIFHRTSILEHLRRDRSQHAPARRIEQASKVVRCHRMHRGHLP